MKDYRPPDSELQYSATFSIFSDWINSIPNFSAQLLSPNVLSYVQTTFPPSFQYQLQFLVESILTHGGFYNPMITPENLFGFMKQV